MLLSLLLASALHTTAADSVTGTWKITGDVMGTPVNELCTLRQADSTITGTCQNTDAPNAKSYDVTGTVKAGRVTFAHGGEYQGSALTLTYNGALAASPRAVSGTLDVQPFGVSGTFSAAPVATPAKP